MCFGGGGNDAVEEQQKAEAERRARIAQAVDAINRMFKYGTNADEALQLQNRISSLQAAEQPHQVSHQVAVMTPAEAVGGNYKLGQAPVQAANTKLGYTRAPQFQTVTETVPGVDNSDAIQQAQQQLAAYAAAAQKPYDTYAQNIQEQLMQDLNRQRAEANRQVEFSLARRGLTGGSADINAGETLLHDYNQGVLQAQQKAQQARAGFVNADQQAKQQLIAMAQAGLNTGQAQQQALDAIRANLANAQAQATNATLGDVFHGLGQAQLANQIQQGRQAAQQAYNRRFGYINHTPVFGTTS